ncbi:alpha/beta-type small acid-soluble spore protein [Clostridium estertheticum]|uniref:small, acid-soluble spore protein, alpha/beta type n=1 Tax=Clostridium estertheticum TaxID=238834 RepID=UPI0013E95FE5|nr:small, acid-soluble spore protein, alpha/beta type [Clostridium estertheticum]MBZ9686123.1 alpha/beta-type small acid-soluble spore protein [Clostridium estertheticum]
MDEKIEYAKSKTDQAKMLGVKIPEDGYWGDYSSKICGSVGGAMSDNSTKGDVATSNEK